MIMMIFDDNAYRRHHRRSQAASDASTCFGEFRAAVGLHSIRTSSRDLAQAAQQEPVWSVLLLYAFARLEQCLDTSRWRRVPRTFGVGTTWAVAGKKQDDDDDNDMGFL